MKGGIFSFPSVTDICDVTEMFSRYYVDPDIAQKNIPSKWRVKIHDNVKALLLVMVQNSSKMVLDSLINTGSVGMSHIWVEIEGPHEVVTPLPGTNRSLPKRYWYILPYQVDSYLARILFKLAGVSSKIVRNVSVGGDPNGTRSGEVLEGGPDDEKYSWQEVIQLYPNPVIEPDQNTFAFLIGVGL